MSDDEQEDLASRRARLRAARRGRKRERRPMEVSGKSIFVLKRIIEERARKARQQRATD